LLDLGNGGFYGAPHDDQARTYWQAIARAGLTRIPADGLFSKGRQRPFIFSGFDCPASAENLKPPAQGG
jgi:hypothetical protein